MMFPVIPMLYRARAREILKKNLSTALMVSFLAALPGLLTQVYANIASKDLLELLRYHMLTIAEAIQKSVSDSQLMSLLNRAGAEMLRNISPTLELAMVLSFLAALITPVLTLGLTAHLLKLARGEEGSQMDVFSRLGCFFKAIAQNIVTAVKMMLWMLPGLALSIAATVLMYLTRSDLFTLLYMGGTVLGMVLMIRAALHYSLSAIVLADDPSVGVFGSIRRSVELMRQHKMDFVRVYLSFILWNIAASWVSSILGAMIPVLGTASSLAFQLVLGLYVNMTIVLFYLSMKGEIHVGPSQADMAELQRMMKEQVEDAPRGNNDGDDNNDDDMLN